MKLIPNAKKAWRMLSVQIAAGAVVFSVLPAEQQAAILALMGMSPAHIPGALGVSIILARLIDQPKVSAPRE